MRSALVHWVIGSLLLLASWGGASPLVLCVGSQGHAALESPLTGCCGGPEACGTPAGVPGGDAGQGAGSSATHPPEEGRCLDAPLPLWQTTSDSLRPPTSPPALSAGLAGVALPPAPRIARPRLHPLDAHPSPPLDHKTVLRI